VVHAEMLYARDEDRAGSSVKEYVKKGLQPEAEE
jgi:hypothetical protein